MMDTREKMLVYGFIVLAIITLSAFFLTGCTLSFTNVSTHGSASDVVDSTPTSDVKTDADLKIPLPGTL